VARSNVNLKLKYVLNNKIYYINPVVGANIVRPQIARS